MSNVVEPPQTRGTSQELRSQVALELLLNLYALVAAGILLRCLLRTLGVSDRIWLGDIVYRWTDLLVVPFNQLPGATYEIYRALTIADFTLLAGAILFLLGFYSRGVKRHGR